MTEYNPPSETLTTFNSKVFRTSYTPLTLGDGDKRYRRKLNNVYLTNSLTLNNSFRIGSNGDTPTTISTTTIYGIDNMTSTDINDTVVGSNCFTLHPTTATGSSVVVGRNIFPINANSGTNTITTIGSNIFSLNQASTTPTAFGANICPIFLGGPNSNLYFGSNNHLLATTASSGTFTIFGYNNVNSSVTNTLSRGTAIGSSCINSLTGNSNDSLTVGYNVGSIRTSGTNCIVIGSGANPLAASSGNQITLGNASITALRCNAPLTTLSDIRDKKNIEPLDKGIEFVNQLKPVKFDWNTRDGAKKDTPQIGFIAQDLLEIGADVPNLVSTENPDKLEAAYDVLLPILIKAVQDLSAKVKIQQEILRMKLISKGMV